MFGFFGLGGLLYIGVFLLNAVAILSEDRFLARIGLSHASQQQPSFTGAGGGGYGSEAGFRTKLINLISSIRLVTRVPLIFINTLIIIYELLLG